MAKLKNEQLDLIFYALSDTGRRRMLDLVMTKELSVTELSESFEMSYPAVLKHLNILEEAGLISQERSGQFKICSFRPMAMRDVTEWFQSYEKFWNLKLDSLGKFLAAKSDRKEKEK